MKKVLIVLICSIIVISSTSTVMAKSNMDIKNNDVEIIKSDNVFDKFLLIVEDIDKITIISESEGDINNEISDDIKRNLSLNNYNKVLDLLEKNDASLSYTVEKDVNIFDIGSEVNRTEYVYHLKYDNDNKFRKEWLTRMDISYRENANGTLTAMGNPRITVEANFGSAFNIDISNLSTGYSYKNGSKHIDFYCSYSLKAKLVIPVEIGGIEFPIGKTFNWGTIHANYIQK